MCLIGKRELKIAKEDMTVYKSLVGRTAPIYTFTYTLGQLYHTTLREDGTSYADTIARDAVTKSGIRNELLISIGSGFHSCKTKERARSLKMGMDMYECTIPKGSEYYEDFSDLIVSNQIIINKKLETYVLDNPEQNS